MNRRTAVWAAALVCAALVMPACAHAAADNSVGVWKREVDQTKYSAPNLNPIVQMNDGDVFWQSNPFVQETLGGCGYDLAPLWPDITPLGGATELGDTISLGYVSIGAGRLWLVESDWPDGQTTFTDQSLRLMRYMVRTR